MRTSLALTVALGCTALVSYRAATVPAPRPARAATVDERAEIAREVAKDERAWINETTQNFPSDSWSQRDDFHGRELRKVQELAHEKKVRVEDVLRAVDEDIHAGTTKLRRANAVPCKPRPFYD